MPERKLFVITRTIVYQVEHSAYSREVIKDLLDMKAPFAWRETYQDNVIKEKYETPKERSKGE